MKTPIIDFVRDYADKNIVRLHMPGHKGISRLGFEALDITEIEGADVLYSPSSIILESENNASRLFGTGHTYYSTEGSSLCIKAMLALASKGQKNTSVLAARNVHKAFVYACALLDIDVDWLYPESESHLCACNITPSVLDAALRSLDSLPCAVYVTSPDYLGNILDIAGLAEVCHAYKIPLLVDNAHGAYLNFLSESKHPIALGADMCCDSAHKTLPVLTGGAYLHISKEADKYCESARERLSLFASTSPSYLILQSLDACNLYIEDGYADSLCSFCAELDILKASLADAGYKICDTEPLKLVIDACASGMSGKDIDIGLRERGVEIEFSDDCFAVMMLTPENSGDIERLHAALLDIYSSSDKSERENTIGDFGIRSSKRVMSIREATLSESEIISVSEAKGRICASVCVSCPPAVPIVVSGELIEARHIKEFEYYKTKEISVVK